MSSRKLGTSGGGTQVGQQRFQRLGILAQRLFALAAVLVALVQAGHGRRAGAAVVSQGGYLLFLLLADMGAEVLRIESPTRMDLLRVLPPHDGGVSASHAYLNRNKRSLALDLKQAEALEIVRALDKDNEHIEVIGLAYEEIEADDLKAFLEERPVVYPIAILDVYNPPADFATPRGLPLTYLIAPDGKVAKQFLGPVTGREIEAAIAASGGPKAGA
mgnify:CR=1 FL=1